MKKMILAALVAVASINANAQVWLGGNVSFSHEDIDGAGYTQFEILPEIGYTLSDKWDLALRCGYSYGKVEDDDASSAFEIEPYARYTFWKSGKVSFFVDGGFNIKTGDFVAPVTYYNGNHLAAIATDDNTQFSIGFRPGVKFAASDRITLVATIGSLNYTSISDVDYSKFGFDFNTNALKLGLYYSF